MTDIEMVELIGEEMNIIFKIIDLIIRLFSRILKIVRFVVAILCAYFIFSTLLKLGPGNQDNFKNSSHSYIKSNEHKNNTNRRNSHKK